jgi:hypothetical protein
VIIPQQHNPGRIAAEAGPFRCGFCAPQAHGQPPVPAIRLDLGAMAWAGVPCCSGGTKAGRERPSPSPRRLAATPNPLGDSVSRLPLCNE